MPLNTSDLNKTICMEMRMEKAMNILSLCHGSTKSSGNFVTPPEQIVGPNKFTFPSIDAAIRTIPTANSSTNENNSSLNSKYSSSAVAVTSNPTSNNNNNSNMNSNNMNNSIFNNRNSSSNKDNKDTTSSNLILNQNYNVHNSTNADLASVDSSDTFMSCQTHPFLSQGDLTSAPDDDFNNLCDFDMIDADNLYISSSMQPKNANFSRGGSLYSGPVNIIVDSTLSVCGGQVKKSTSGDTALRSLAASPIDDQYKALTNDRGSRVSLNETPVPKHRKTRFQQQQQQQQQLQQNYNNNPSNKLKTRFDDGGAGSEESGVESLNANSNSSSNTKKNRRASFMPSKIITTATKQLINQHLFGLQSMGSKGM